MNRSAEAVSSAAAIENVAPSEHIFSAMLKLLLVLLPMVVSAWGLYDHQLLQQLTSSHYGMLAWLLIGCMASQCLAWLVWRQLGVVSLAIGSVIYWLAHLSYFAGFGAVLCFMALVLAAQAVGSCLVRDVDADVLERFVPGMAILVSIMAWLLPFPVHDSRVYYGLLTVLIMVRWKQLRADGSILYEHILFVSTKNPWMFVFAVTLGGFASMGLWLPSLNYDDNSVHIALQTQLLQDGYYRFDIASQVWAMSPWFNSVWHGLGAMILGAESRAAGNLVWLLLGAVGAWRLAAALGAGCSTSLLAAAVYLTHPLTVYFGTTLQVDGPSAALLLVLASMLASPAATRRPSAWTIGALIGMLLALKVTNVVYLVIPCMYVTLLAFRYRGFRWWWGVVGVALFTGGSSYVYALLVTGSPVFPLFNTLFQSPYYPLIGFSDPRWHVGMTATLPWDLTFATQYFMEAIPGAIGLTLIVLSGALVLGLLLGGRTSFVAIASLLPAAVLFHEVQYVRYIFPALACLGVVAIVALDSLPRRYSCWWQVPVVILCCINLMLMSTTSWIMRSGAWEGLVAHGPRYANELRRQAIPPQLLLERMLARQPSACALNTDASQPFTARFVGHALSVAWYDPQSQRAVAWAREDQTGQRWKRILTTLGVSHVIQLRDSDPMLQRALGELGSELQDREGNLELWQVASDVVQCRGGFFQSRDTAHHLLHNDDMHR